MKNVKVLMLLLCSPIALLAQSQTFYNWKGNALEIFEKPDIKSKVLTKIASGAVVNVTGAATSAAFPIYLSYYGDTITTKTDENDKRFYTMNTTWVSVKFDNMQGYVPQAYLSHLPLKKLSESQREYKEGENQLLERLKFYFGKPVTHNKKQLKKQDKDEVHFKESFSFANKVTYTNTPYYFTDSGAGSEEHAIFLPGFKLNEAILFFLEITNVGDLRPDNIKSFNRQKSSYDNFGWWYQPYYYDDEGNEVPLKKGEYAFSYSTEVGGSTVLFKVANNGVQIVYTYGGC